LEMRFLPSVDAPETEEGRRQVARWKGNERYGTNVCQGTGASGGLDGLDGVDGEWSLKDFRLPVASLDDDRENATAGAESVSEEAGSWELGAGSWELEVGL
jgi:hypothetical protein